MLSNLQVLRGVAAVGVVFFHTGYRLPGDWHTEFFGVATFFVISGFIMCFITRDRADNFLSKRLERIVPLYWLCTLALLVVMFGTSLSDTSTWASPLDGRPGEPLWGYVTRSLTFAPIADKYPILNVGWSLNYEMYFYLLFALALWINRRMAPLVVIACLIILNQASGTICTAPTCHYLSLDDTKFFIAGIVVFYALHYIAPRAPRRSIVWIGAALIAICYGSQFLGPWWATSITPGLYTVLATAAPIVIVASALLIEYAGCSITWRPLIVLGDASYAIYLTHPIVFEVMKATGGRWPQIPTPSDSVAVMLFYMAVATSLGLLVHLYVENPLLRLIRRKKVATIRPACVSAASSVAVAGMR